MVARLSSRSNPEKISFKDPHSMRSTHGDELLSLEKIDRKIIRGFLAWLNLNGQTKRTVAAASRLCEAFSNMRKHSIFSNSTPQKILKVQA